MTKQVYIASGWFNENQAKDLEDIKGALQRTDMSYFSPKDEIVCPGEADEAFRQAVFDGNIADIYAPPPVFFSHISIKNTFY